MLTYILLLQFLGFTYGLDYRASCSGTTVKECTAPGLFCETCSSLVLCLQTESGEFEKTGRSKCQSGKKCVHDECTTNPNPICDGTACLDFPCQNVGMFPDPFLCNKFIMCVQETAHRLKAYSHECSNNFGYNIKTFACDIKLEHDICDTSNNKYPIPLCEGPGQNDALTENPSIYYVCEQYSWSKNVLYPMLRLCPNGKVYSKNYGCVEKKCKLVLEKYNLSEIETAELSLTGTESDCFNF